MSVKHICILLSREKEALIVLAEVVALKEGSQEDIR